MCNGSGGAYFKDFSDLESKLMKKNHYPKRISFKLGNNLVTNILLKSKVESKLQN